MRKQAIALILAAMLLMLAGCGGNGGAAAASTPAAPQSTAPESATAQSATPASTAPQSTAPPASTGTEDVKSLQGTIEQYDGGDTMMVVDATGVDFVFPLAGADLHVGEEGFAVGDEVVVYYYGTLVDMPDVQNVTVGEVKKAD